MKPDVKEVDRAITDSTSVYLDFIRATAAFLVFILHMGFFSGYHIPVIGNSGDEAVLAFFVLSGLVIPYTAVQKHKSSLDFINTRLARLWSIVIPALALTIVCDTVGQHWSLPAYGNLQPYNAIKWGLADAANMLFLNQIWNFNIWAGSNGPLWSISYEFLYYCIFAAAFYYRGWRRILLTAIAVAIAGPKILVAFPVWLTGAALYFILRRRGPAKGWIGISIWIGSIFVSAAYVAIHMTQILYLLFPAAHALAIRQWPVDFWPKSYFIGIIIALNIYGFDAVSSFANTIIAAVRGPVRLLADASFGIYLFHYPLGLFIKALLWRLDLRTGTIFVVTIYFLTFSGCFFLGLLFDPLRKPLRKFLNRSTGVWSGPVKAGE